VGPILYLLAIVAAPCHVRDDRPDPACTPGAFDGTVDVAEVCGETTRARRRVTAAARRRVLVEYGYLEKPTRDDVEIDHLIPLELGGSNEAANLWPEPAPGFHEKDRLENRLHREVCAGHMDLADAQRAIARDWVATAATTVPPGRRAHRVGHHRRLPQPPGRDTDTPP
jgi:hypothetical protein